MEELPVKDKYLQKKLSELEEEKSFLPVVSLLDLVFLGAIALFFVGSGLIWYHFPGITSHKNSPRIENKNPAGDFSQPGIVISEELKKKMSDESLRSIDPNLFERSGRHR